MREAPICQHPFTHHAGRKPSSYTGREELSIVDEIGTDAETFVSFRNRRVVCGRRPARRARMTNIHRLSGIVDVDGFQYEWELRSEPQWSESEGWKGLTIALLRKHTQRGALLEFPPPKRLLKGLQRGRLQISDAIVSRGIQAALDAGWDPASRGRPMVFMVDADGN